MSDLPNENGSTPTSDVEANPILSANMLEDDGVSSNTSSDDELTYESVLPTDEQLSEASPDVHGIIPLNCATRDELGVMYNRRIEQLGPDKFLQQVAIPGTYENILWFTYSNYSAEAERTGAAISEMEDTTNFNYNLVRDDKVVLGSSGFRPQRTTEVKMVSGEAGIVEMLSTKKGKIRRIPLYNSGFCLDLRSPSNFDISEMLRRCRADREEYGRDFGSHFYAYSDLIIKRSVFDTIMSLSIGSSLKDWKKPGVLAQKLKLPDYDVILTHIAALMYPEGYPDFRHICTRPLDAEHPTGCNHVTQITADLTKLIHTKFAALNENAVAHMVKSRMGTEPMRAATIDLYHKELGFEDTEIVHDDFMFTMTVPSMADYFLAGESFYQELINEIPANNRKEIYDAVAFRESKHYIPWIKRVSSMQDGRVGRVSEDKRVIAFVLDEIATEDASGTLIAQFIKYINHAKLSHVCYKTFVCEACGYEPITSSGFLTVDPQQSFFIQSTQKLNRSIASAKKP